MILWQVKNKIGEEGQHENSQQEQEPIWNGRQSGFAQADFMVGDSNNHGEIQTNRRSHLADLNQDRDNDPQPNWIKTESCEERKDDR